MRMQGRPLYFTAMFFLFCLHWRSQYRTYQSLPHVLIRDGYENGYAKFGGPKTAHLGGIMKPSTRGQRLCSLSEQNQSALTDHASRENHMIN